MPLIGSPGYPAPAGRRRDLPVAGRRPVPPNYAQPRFTRPPASRVPMPPPAPPRPPQPQPRPRIGPVPPPNYTTMPVGPRTPVVPPPTRRPITMPPPREVPNTTHPPSALPPPSVHRNVAPPGEAPVYVPVTPRPRYLPSPPIADIAPPLRVVYPKQPMACGPKG